jgi:oligopeptide transport system ATP-binding protein
MSSLDSVLDVQGLSIEALSPVGEALPLVKNVAFSCRAGEITALIGESGSGKSLTAAAMLGVLPPETYRVTTRSLLVAGHRLESYIPEALAPVRGSRVGYVVQEPGTALDPTMRVGDQLAELFMVHRGLGRAAARREAIRHLDLVRIPNAVARADDYPHSFSGGMKQRVIIAGAVALSPQLLVADEPTTALDVTVQAEILALIDELRSNIGMAVLLITHDLGVVYQVAHHVLVMYAGRIVESGDVETVCTTPAHPYTAGLLASVPDLARPGAVTAAIPGNPPRPGPDRGCAFMPRCARAEAPCSLTIPLLTPAGRSDAACHYPLRTESHGRASALH